MAKRARFETNQGFVTLSRGTLTLSSGKSVEEYTTIETLFNEEQRRLQATVRVASGKPETHRFDFKVIKTPREIREEGMRVFVPKEHTRLRHLLENRKHEMDVFTRNPKDEKYAENQGAPERLATAYAALKSFEVKYAVLLPKPEAKKEKKSSKRASKKSRKTETKTKES